MRVEAESGKLSNVAVVTARPGFSGKGYVTGFKGKDDRVTMSCTAPGGLYEAVIRYSSPSGPKGYELEVNGIRGSGMFAKTGDGFAYHRAGLVELRAGENTLAIYGGWHYYEIDCIDLMPVQVPPAPVKPPKRLSDPQASAKARATMGYLIDQYGKGTLSGVYSVDDAQYVLSTAGKTPAILGGDLMEYSPSRVEHGSRPEGTSERLIEQAKAGYILTLSWHWNAPKDLVDKMLVDEQGREINALWYKGFMSNATTFDVAKAMADRDSEDYRLLLRDIDVIAGQLKKFADADVPVLWRPLHEAEGAWFWWGAKGPKPFVELWRVMYDRLTNYHHLHNLIWVYTCGGNMEWYPGDQYVDIVGIDAYPSDRHDAMSGMWMELQRTFAGRKLVAISEYGMVADVERMMRFGARWSYFVTWGDCVKRSPDDEIRAVYNCRDVINRDRVKMR